MFRNENTSLIIRYACEVIRSQPVYIVVGSTSAYLTRARAYKWPQRDLRIERTSAVCFSPENCPLLSARPSSSEIFSSSSNPRVFRRCISDAPTPLLSKTRDVSILFQFLNLSICTFYRSSIFQRQERPAT